MAAQAAAAAGAAGAGGGPSGAGGGPGREAGAAELGELPASAVLGTASLKPCRNPLRKKGRKPWQAEGVAGRDDEPSGCAPSLGALASMSRKIAGVIAPALDAVTGVLAGTGVGAFRRDRVPGGGEAGLGALRVVGEDVLVTVEMLRWGWVGMEAAGAPLFFAGIACHDARAPDDTWDNVAGARSRECPPAARAARGDRDRHGPGCDLGMQAADALEGLKDTADELPRCWLRRHQPGHPEEVWYLVLRDAAAAGDCLNAARRSCSRRSATHWPPGWPPAPMTT